MSSGKIHRNDANTWNKAVAVEWKSSVWGRLRPRAWESDGPGSLSWQCSAYRCDSGQGSKLSTQSLHLEKEGTNTQVARW